MSLLYFKNVNFLFTHLIARLFMLEEGKQKNRRSAFRRFCKASIHTSVLISTS